MRLYLLISLFVGFAAAQTDFVEIFEDDFDTGPGQWTVAGTSLSEPTSFCGTSFGTILGGHNKFGRGVTAVRQYNNLQTHNAVLVELNYYFIRTWDHELGKLSAGSGNGFNTIWSYNYQAGRATSNSCSGQRTHVEKIRVLIDHSDPLLELRLSSTIDQTAGDESWGFNEVKVTLLNLRGSGTANFAQPLAVNDDVFHGTTISNTNCQGATGIQSKSGSTQLPEAYAKITYTGVPTHNALRIRFKMVTHHTVGGVTASAEFSSSEGLSPIFSQSADGIFSGTCSSSAPTITVDRYVFHSTSDLTLVFRSEAQFRGLSQPAFSILDLQVDPVTLGSAPWTDAINNFANGPNFFSGTTLDTSLCSRDVTFLGPTRGAVEDKITRKFTGLPSHQGVRISMKLIMMPTTAVDREVRILVDGRPIWTRSLADARRTNKGVTTCGNLANLPEIPISAVTLDHTQSTLDLTITGTGNQYSIIAFAIADVRVDTLSLSGITPSNGAAFAAGKDPMTLSHWGGFNVASVSGCPAPAVGSSGTDEVSVYSVISKKYTNIPTHTAIRITMTYAFLQDRGDQLGSVTVSEDRDGGQIWAESATVGENDNVCGSVTRKVDHTMFHKETTLDIYIEGSSVTEGTKAGFAIYDLEVLVFDLGTGKWVDAESDFSQGPDNWNVPQLPGVSDCDIVFVLGGHGDFGTKTKASKTYTELPGHNALRIEFRYWFFRTWDTETAYVEVDGNRLWETQFIGNNHQRTCEGATASFEDVSLILTHSDPSVTLLASSTIDQGAFDEAWGISNVRVIPFQQSGAGTEPFKTGLQSTDNLQWAGEQPKQVLCEQVPAINDKSRSQGSEAFLTNTFTNVPPHNAVRIQFDAYHLHDSGQQTLKFHVGSGIELVNTVAAAGAGTACSAQRPKASFDRVVLNPTDFLKLDFKAETDGAIPEFAIANLILTPVTLGSEMYDDQKSTNSFDTGPDGWLGITSATVACGSDQALGVTTSSVDEFFQKEYTDLPSHNTLVFRASIALRRRLNEDRARVYVDDVLAWEANFGSLSGNTEATCGSETMTIANANVAIQHSKASAKIRIVTTGNQYGHMRMALLDTTILPLSVDTTGSSMGDYVEGQVDDGSDYFVFDTRTAQTCDANIGFRVSTNEKGIGFATKQYTNLPTHTGLRISFTYYFSQTQGQTQIGTFSVGSDSLWSDRRTSTSGDACTDGVSVTRLVRHTDPEVILRFQALSESDFNPDFVIGNLRVEAVTFGVEPYANRVSDFSNGPDLWDIGTTALPGTTKCGETVFALGGHGLFGQSASATKKFTAVGTHTALRIEFRFWIIRTWDHELARVFVDNELVWSQSQFNRDPENLCSGQATSYKDVSILVAHTAADAAIMIDTTLQQNAFDESWAISDFRLIPLELQGSGTGDWVQGAENFNDNTVVEQWSGKFVTTANCGVNGVGLTASGFDSRDTEAFLRKRFSALPSHNALQVLLEIIPANGVQDMEFTIGSTPIFAGKLSGSQSCSGTAQRINAFIIHNEDDVILDIRSVTETGIAAGFTISNVNIIPTTLGFGKWVPSALDFASGPEGFLGSSVPKGTCDGGAVLGPTSGNTNAFFRKSFVQLPAHVGLLITLDAFIAPTDRVDRAFRMLVDGSPAFTLTRRTAVAELAGSNPLFSAATCGNGGWIKAQVSVLLDNHASESITIQFDGTGSVHTVIPFAIQNVQLAPLEACQPGFGQKGDIVDGQRQCEACQAGFFTPNRPHTSPCIKHRVCTDSQFEEAPPSQTSDRICTRLSDCTSEQYADPEATKTSDRQCRDKLQCVDGQEYEISPGSDVTNRECQRLTTCTSLETWESRAPTATTDRVCSRCSTCPGGETAKEVCTVLTDTVCADCDSCGAGEYIKQPCESGKNTVCETCRVCEEGFYAAGVCAGTEDFTCQPCTSSCPEGQYISRRCTPSGNQDIGCSDVTECKIDEYEFAPPGRLQDRECRKFTTCAPGFFVDADPTTTSDRVCAPCPSGQFSTITNADACQPCTGTSECQVGQFLAGTCTGTTSPKCQDCERCDPGLYQTGGCTGDLQPRVCARCTTESECSDGFFLAGSCGTSENQVDFTSCESCHVTCETCDGPSRTECLTCAENRFKQLEDNGEFECVGSCKKGTYLNIETNTCEACNSGCADCSGPSASECTDCKDQRFLKPAEGSRGGYGTCEACTTSGFFQTERDGFKLCATCTVCPQGQFETSPCSTTSDTVCERCPAGSEFQDETGQKQCKPVSDCNPGFEEETGPSTSSDRVCKACDNAFFQTDKGGLACRPWTPCGSTQYESTAGTSSSDRRCTQVTNCAVEGKYQSTPPTSTSDAQCTTWTTCQPGQEVSVTPTRFRNRACQSCQRKHFSTTRNQDSCERKRTCPSDEFSTNPLDLTADSVCEKKRVCTFPAQWTLEVAGLNNQCRDVSVCPTNWEQIKAPTPTSDRECQGAIVFVFNGDYNSLVGTSSDANTFKSSMVRQLRTKLGFGLSDVTSNDIELVPGSIKATVRTQDQNVYDKMLGLVNDNDQLRITHKGNTLSGRPSTLQASRSSNGSSDNTTIIAIAVTAAVLICLVVLVACYIARRDKKDPVVQTGIDFDEVQRRKERAANAAINPVYATADPTGIMSMSGMAAALGEGGFENPLYEDEQQEGSYSDVMPGAVADNGDGYLDVGGAAPNSDDAGYMDVNSKPQEGGYMDVHGQPEEGGYMDVAGGFGDEEDFNV